MEGWDSSSRRGEHRDEDDWRIAVSSSVCRVYMVARTKSYRLGYILEFLGIMMREFEESGKPCSSVEEVFSNWSLHYFCEGKAIAALANPRRGLNFGEKKKRDRLLLAATAVYCLDSITHILLLYLISEQKLFRTFRPNLKSANTLEAEEHRTRLVGVGSLPAAAVDVRRILVEEADHTPVAVEVVHSPAVEVADRILGPGADSRLAAGRTRQEPRRIVPEEEHHHTDLEAERRSLALLGDESLSRLGYHRTSQWSRA